MSFVHDWVQGVTLQAKVAYELALKDDFAQSGGIIGDGNASLVEVDDGIGLR